ncbi:MAG: ChbG/HpnK family deacetylase, partial [Deltaproteobacteria bacterium]|nr:ChbG/HpnK family deacetylase [Deltaproteobacteria bacterium]
GVVRSVSINANFPAAGDSGRLAHDFPRVSAGVHFNLAVGRPVLPPGRIPSLVGADGEFLDARFPPRLLTGRVRFSEMVAELSAQAALLADAGLALTHWDGHRNQHLLPGYFEAALLAARRHGIRRMRTHDHWLFPGDGPRLGPVLRHYAGNPARVLRHGAGALRMAEARLAGMRMADRMVTPLGEAESSRKYRREMWEGLFRVLPPGTSEVYCHPGYPDEMLRRYAKYVEERRIEAEVLGDATLADAAAAAGVELISFREL